MAKRKPARSSAGKKKTAGRKTAGRARKAARPRKAARKSGRASSRTAKKTARPARKRPARPLSVAKKTSRNAASVSAKPSARAVRSASGGARNAAPKATARTRKAASKKAGIPVRASAKASARSRRIVEREVGRKAPSLNRERRVVVDDDIVQTPPSSLDLDRTASAARSGRRSLKDRFSEHTETSPALTAGDVDADWESAYSVGDEAPGGDNPTPDQDIVDDIGRAVGNEYQDNEELKGANKIEKRDRNRWELDPASSEDWDDR